MFVFVRMIHKSMKGINPQQPEKINNNCINGTVSTVHHIRLTLPIAPDGSIHLVARDWAVCGVHRTKI